MLDHHPQAGGALGLAVDFGADVAEEPGVVEAAPTGVGAADRHAGVGYRGDQFGAVLGHFGVQRRGGHLEVRRGVGLQVAEVNQERFEIGGVLFAGLGGGAPAGFALALIPGIDLALDAFAPLQQGAVGRVKFLYQFAEVPEYGFGAPGGSGGYFVLDEVE